MAAVAAPPSDRGYSGFVSGQASCHNHDGGPVHHGLVVSGPAFVVADQPAVPQQPAEGALDDPSAADDLAAGLVAGQLPSTQNCRGGAAAVQQRLALPDGELIGVGHRQDMWHVVVGDGFLQTAIVIILAAGTAPRGNIAVA